jgi:three-Cys-motif partner protein
VIPSLQQFGDQSWTQDKLERVRKYLVAYTKIMSKRKFKYGYIDGFAGTGYHELKQNDETDAPSLFPEIDEPEVRQFLDGSARLALRVEPRFQKYVLIEKNPQKAKELEKLRDEFPDQTKDIKIEKREANAYLREICGTSWKNHRAVLFLDPFGMQVRWQTIEAIAKTKAIDTWILFPVSAVNRLLRRDGNIPDSWRRRLDSLFGEPKWFDVFFPKEQANLFQQQSEFRQKTADMQSIGTYFNKRLRSVFAGVASNPYSLCNSKGAPLFLLCFAAANPSAAKTAIKIAHDILKSD